MTERFQNEGAGKGDKSRVFNFKKYQDGMERLYGKKTWQFWATWEGYHLDEIEFDDSGLENEQQIRYQDYIARLKNVNK